MRSIVAHLSRQYGATRFDYSIKTIVRPNIGLRERHLSMRAARRKSVPQPPPNPFWVWFEETKLYLLKKKLLFRGEMVKLRLLKISIPEESIIAGMPKRTYTFVYQLSNLAGHGAFIFLAVSYMESDFINLRMYALSGITLSMIFQYYREKPLWIPLRWNSFFFVINTIMIAALVKEANDAANIPEDQKQLYTAIFERRGMKLVDFLHLMALAEKRILHAGDKVITAGQRNNRVFLVHSGRLSVRRGGNLISKLGENQFAGEMAFLRWQGKREDDDPRHAEGELSTADVTCLEDCIVYSWDFTDLHQLLIREPTVGLTFEGSISSDMNHKLLATSAQDLSPTTQYKQLLSGALMDGEVLLSSKIPPFLVATNNYDQLSHDPLSFNYIQSHGISSSN
jgi:CRP-like cAMP-binding protein